MNILNSKRSETITLVLIVLIVVVFIGWLVNLASRECRSNNDCSSGFYCGSDYSCHQIPVVEKTVVQNNLIAPSLIIGVAIITAAIILRWKKNFRAGISQEANEGKKSTSPLKTP